ncbi:TonB-dependent receptor [Nitratiruptor sp. SB155-2]|uniref:TonB-dependent receptor n=1 Tax=Nitratiruptor sp. (strain SB155-2) TaxID=387092 RepID=UPI0001587329|nr:TonB-dependent receptor [Nitratiruptor sp. SB155-2]BAF70727.1 TonB-dependent copper receptor [Nitratiruptor sp. SB155-2]
MTKPIVLCFSLATLLFAEALQVQTVTVESSIETEKLSSDQVQFTRQQDLSEILSSTNPEINMVRASAIGNDIVLRGFKRDDINVLIDGAKIYGACPNRMDPPAMHISISQIEKVIVKEGPFDVENFGSMGGMINVVTKDPKPGFSGSIQATIGSFDYKKGAVNFNGGDEKFKFSLGFVRESSGQYEDGSGRTLVEQNWAVLGKTNPNAYKEQYKNMDAYKRGVVRGKFIYDIDENQQLKVRLYSDKANDVLYPAFQMDAQLDETIMLNADYTIKHLSTYSDKLVLSAYYDRVKHDMGTEFRNAPGMLYRTHRAKSETKGVKLKNIFLIGAWNMETGIDVSKRGWNGVCLNEPSKTPRQVRIPDVDTINRGVFIKGTRKYGSWDLKAGIRYDWTNIDTNVQWNNNPLIPAPVVNYYSNKTSRDFNDISANVVAKYHFNDTDALFFAIGQGIRVPDANELYFIAYNKNLTNPWVRRGNPDLKEVKNREVDFGYEGSLGEVGNYRVTLFYSDLKDYIYAYKDSAGTLTYTNIDAHIYGAAFDSAYSVGEYGLLEAKMAYQRGEKDDQIAGQSDDDMAMVPPFHASVSYSYDTGDYFASAEIRYSAKWNNYDSDNGEQAIKSWTVVNLKASKKISSQFSIDVGVDNLFDQDYAVNNTYVGRALVSGAVPLLIHEPGRYLYTNLRYTF